VQWSGPSPQQDPSNWQTINYKHDVYGRRSEKKVDGYSTRYLYACGEPAESNGLHVIAEYDGNNNLLRKYIYGPGIDQPVCMIEVAESNAVYYYHYDALGSVVALSDSSGDTVQTYEYSVYGQVAVEDINHPNPYMFAGRRFDIEIGLYYNRARYYNPFTGRFLQTDPIGYTDGMNMYTYCKNNPLNCLDPLGTTVIDYCLSGEWDYKTEKNRVRFSIYHDEILDNGTSVEDFYFDTYDQWLNWAMNYDEKFTDEWMAEQVGYQLATYDREDREGENYFDEYLFWNIKALEYMDTIRTAEILMMESYEINFRDDSDYFDHVGDSDFKIG